MSVFLRGPRVDVLAPDAADDGFGEAARPWLLPLGGGAGAGAIEVVWAPARGGPTQGSLALVHVDWIARSAFLVGSLVPGADPKLAHEALSLVVRYAAEELALDRLEARARTGERATESSLTALGFRHEGRLAAAWRDPEPIDVDLFGRVEPRGPR